MEWIHSTNEYSVHVQRRTRSQLCISHLGMCLHGLHSHMQPFPAKFQRFSIMWLRVRTGRECHPLPQNSQMCCISKSAFILFIFFKTVNVLWTEWIQVLPSLKEKQNKQIAFVICKEYMEDDTFSWGVLSNSVLIATVSGSLNSSQYDTVRIWKVKVSLMLHGNQSIDQYYCKPWSHDSGCKHLG